MEKLDYMLNFVDSFSGGHHHHQYIKKLKQLLQTAEIKENLHCERCVGKVPKDVQTMKGVMRVDIDSNSCTIM
ncbi:hypothetical protein AQUCO_07500037v1 [Aquilegia coerulea]|uniref:HMA domain-containing protein n=1 Tax=Aquilegia coerulea TaxID=218851 RepID=A0A2G5C9B0_AQUCA|nr:hypothetical protein AQUCO_07500037v1 [Aquilegia coerulea]